MSRDVFISHWSEDSDVAERICAGLERENISCWIAPRDIPGGKQWPVEIDKGIQSTRGFFVIVLSSNSRNATQVGREAALANRQGLQFIPFRVENIDPPAALRYYLEGVQLLDGFGDQFDAAVARLVDIVRSKMGPWVKLVGDLENLEQALHSLASLLDHPDPRRYPDLLHMVEVAAKPVCNARKIVSELGDQSTLHELDGICKTVGTMRTAGEIAAVGAEIMARAEEDFVKKLREKLFFQT